MSAGALDTSQVQRPNPPCALTASTHSARKRRLVRSWSLSPTLGLKYQHAARREPHEEVGPVFPHHTAIDVVYLKAEMVIFHPGGHFGRVVEDKGLGRLPTCCRRTQKLMWLCAVYSHGLPVYQVRMSPVVRIGRSRSNTGSSRSVFSWRIASQMCCTTLVMLRVTMRRALEVVIDEQCGREGNLVRPKELLDKPHQLRE